MSHTETERAHAGTFRGAWSHRRWRWLVSSFAVSMAGDFLYSVALVVFLIERTGSAAWVSAAVIGRLVPYTLLSAPAGVLADRVDRRRLMMGLDATRALLLAAMAVVAWSDGPALAAVILAIAASTVSTPHRPATVAATPQLVGEDDLAAANAAESVIAQAAWFVGPALGAAVVTIADPGTAFMVNAGTFVVSALLVSRIGDAGARRPTPVDDDDDEIEHPAGVLSGLSEGVRAVRSDAGLTALVLFICALMFTFGMEQVLHVLVAVDRLGLGPAWVGVMAAAIGAGGLVIAPFTARMGRSPSVGTLLVASGIGVGLPLIVLSVTSSPVVVIAVLAFEGAATIVNEVLLVTVLQRACPDHLLARVFGLQESTSSGTQLLGSILAPILVATAGLGASLWVGGGVAVVATVLLAPALMALTARAEKERRALAPMVSRLRRLALFLDATDAALERIARATVPMSVAAGDVVLTEGDPPEDLYVVETGDLVVTFRGDSDEDREINRMGPDDYFGEIGLLRGAPRTAGVCAETSCELLRIPGQAFLDSLAEPDVLPDPVRRTMATRLARTRPGSAPEPGSA